MVLKRQIEAPEEKQPKDIEKARQEFIKGGGLVASDVQKEKDEEWTKISLRLKVEAIAKIDSLISKKMGVTRTGWIQQAIEDKLQN